MEMKTILASKNWTCAKTNCNQPGAVIRITTKNPEKTKTVTFSGRCEQHKGKTDYTLDEFKKLFE